MSERKILRLFFAIFLMGLVAFGCSSPTGGGGDDGSGNGGDSDDPAIVLEMPGIGEVRYTLLSDNGGRVAWYTGQANHELIAFDARTVTYDLGDGIYDYRTDIYLMDADGSGRTCLTCDIASIIARRDEVLDAREGDHDNDSVNDDLPGFFLGQPEWHPNGRHIVMQVENSNSRHNTYSFMSFGQDQDLWILDSEDLTAAPILEQTMTGAAFLHPHLSRSGNTIIFSARSNGGNYGNIWDFWYLTIADFDISAANPEETISRIEFKQPDGPGFYETTGFVGDSDTQFSYSHTARDGLTVPGYVDDGFITDSPYTSSTRVVNNPDFWDEKPRYSPSGEHIAIMSNRFQTGWTPADGAPELSSELYLGAPGGDLYRLTDFQSFDRYAGKKLLVSDHEWNRIGDKLVVLVQPHGTGNSENGDIWLVELPKPY